MYNQQTEHWRLNVMLILCLWEEELTWVTIFFCNVLYTYLPAAWLICSDLKASDCKIRALFLPSATLISASRIPEKKTLKQIYIKYLQNIERKKKNCIFRPVWSLPAWCNKVVARVIYMYATANAFVWNVYKNTISIMVCKHFEENLHCKCEKLKICAEKSCSCSSEKGIIYIFIEFTG